MNTINDQNQPYGPVSTRATLGARAVAMVGLLLAAASAQATILINAEMSEASHDFYPGDPYDDMGGGSPEAVTTLAALNPGSFVYDFSQAGETTITIEWQAPAGQQFVLTAPDFGDAYLAVSYRAGTSYSNVGGGGINDSTVSFVLNGLDGSANLLYANRQLSNPSGNVIAFQAVFEVSAGSTITFSSATMTTTIPAAFATIYSQAVSDFALTVRSYPASDPGAMLTLQVIPEPGTYVALFGVLALGGGRGAAQALPCGAAKFHGNAAILK